MQSWFVFKLSFMPRPGLCLQTFDFHAPPLFVVRIESGSSSHRTSYRHVVPVLVMITTFSEEAILGHHGKGTLSLDKLFLFPYLIYDVVISWTIRLHILLHRFN